MTDYGYDSLVANGIGLREWKAHCAKQVEVRYLHLVLVQSRGRIGEAAALAKISRRTLLRLMDKHQIDKKAFRVKVAAEKTVDTPRGSSSRTDGVDDTSNKEQQRGEQRDHGA